MCTEEQLLSHIKSAVVRAHKEVHWQKFNDLHKSQGGSVTCYLARLRAQATLCEFGVHCNNNMCTTEVSSADHMISG